MTTTRSILREERRSPRSARARAAMRSTYGNDAAAPLRASGSCGTLRAESQESPARVPGGAVNLKTRRLHGGKPARPGGAPQGVTRPAGPQ